MKPVKPPAPQFCSKIALDLQLFREVPVGPDSVLKLPRPHEGPWRTLGSRVRGVSQFCSKIALDLQLFREAPLVRGVHENP